MRAQPHPQLGVTQAQQTMHRIRDVSGLKLRGWQVPHTVTNINALTSCTLRSVVNIQW